MSNNNILFVFEGQNTEDKIFKNLYNFYINENLIITCAYCSTIYQVYKKILNDEDLDTFNVLKERNPNQELLKDYTRDDFAEIYMFFDYDGHDPIADDSKLKKLLDFFDEETDKGKLYISYPMVESLKHISDYKIFKDLKVQCKLKINYKKLVGDTCLINLQDFTTYDLLIWKALINAHLYKLNYIVNDNYDFPSDIISQIDLFDKQLKKYIEIDSTVSVLNSFPVFLHDYYGSKKLKSLVI